jgi:hypothetical protein
MTTVLRDGRSGHTAGVKALDTRGIVKMVVT